MPTCAKCEVEKPEADFRVRPERNNWRLKRCKECERGVQIKNYYALKQRNPTEWRIRVAISKFRVTRAWLLSTYAAQNGQCALTGRPITLADFEIDHILAESRGGSTDPSNLRLVCRAANAAKGDLTDDELVALCKEIIGRAIMRAEGMTA